MKSHVLMKTPTTISSAMTSCVWARVSSRLGQVSLVVLADQVGEGFSEANQFHGCTFQMECRSKACR